MFNLKAESFRFLKKEKTFPQKQNLPAPPNSRLKSIDKIKFWKKKNRPPAPIFGKQNP